MRLKVNFRDGLIWQDAYGFFVSAVITGIVRTYLTCVPNSPNSMCPSQAGLLQI